MPTVTPILIEGAFDDPHAIRALVEHHGPYPTVSSYLPASATGESQTEAGLPATLPWFRANWAVNGRTAVEGAGAILHNTRFIEAASRLFDSSDVVPTTVVVNVNTPMPPGAVHVDIPSFHGAHRDTYPLRLLQAMGTSGLFEQWRVVEVGAVSWFYDGPGGAYDYWPSGLGGPMRSMRPPFANVALVTDNDRMFHRIARVGDLDAAAPPISPAALVHRTGETWTITDLREPVACYSDEQVRISILWKARIGATSPTGTDPLTVDRVVDIVASDLRARGLQCPRPSSPLSDESWIDLVHATYYRPISVGDRADEPDL